MMWEEFLAKKRSGLLLRGAVLQDLALDLRAQTQVKGFKERHEVINATKEVKKHDSGSR